MGKMEIRKSPNEPVKLISTAFLVNLPTALKLNTHLLVIDDQFSKYILLYTVKDRTTKATAKYYMLLTTFQYSETNIFRSRSRIRIEINKILFVKVSV